MDFPDSIKVGGHEFKIEYPFAFSEDTCTGECDYMHGIIRISDFYRHKERDEQRKKSTLLHEILHAIDHIYNSRTINNSKHCERVIDCLEECWFQILTDNNLYLDNAKFPSKINVGGYTYIVKYPYEFKEIHDKFIDVRGEELKILISDKDENGTFSPYICKVGLIDGLLRIVHTAHNLKMDNRSIGAFAEGLYQVLVDNNLCLFFRGK